MQLSACFVSYPPFYFAELTFWDLRLDSSTRLPSVLSRMSSRMSSCVSVVPIERASVATVSCDMGPHTQGCFLGLGNRFPVSSPFAPPPQVMKGRAEWLFTWVYFPTVITEVLAVSTSSAVPVAARGPEPDDAAAHSSVATSMALRRRRRHRTHGLLHACRLSFEALAFN